MVDFVNLVKLTILHGNRNSTKFDGGNRPNLDQIPTLFSTIFTTIYYGNTTKYCWWKRTLMTNDGQIIWLAYLRLACSLACKLYFAVHLSYIAVQMIQEPVLNARKNVNKGSSVQQKPAPNNDIISFLYSLKSDKLKRYKFVLILFNPEFFLNGCVRRSLL